jgi:ribose 5-phosphate isomerase A
MSGPGKAGPVVTDNGNFIIDADFGVIDDPVALDLKLSRIVGIFETGLFCGITKSAYFGSFDGAVKFKHSK